MNEKLKYKKGDKFFTKYGFLIMTIDKVNNDSYDMIFSDGSKTPDLSDEILAMSDWILDTKLTRVIVNV